VQTFWDIIQRVSRFPLPSQSEELPQGEESREKVRALSLLPAPCFWLCWFQKIMNMIAHDTKAVEFKLKFLLSFFDGIE